MNKQKMFVHTICEVISMDKKFIAAVIVCFAALASVATGTYFVGEKNNEAKSAKVDVVTTQEELAAAQKKVEPETTTPPDKTFYLDEYEAETTAKTVEENTESNAKGDEYLYGLPSEAAAQIKNLKFDNKSKLLWPVKGSIIMQYDMEDTVYYSTLDEYRTNDGIVIQSSVGTAVKAAADGVITKIDESDEYGVCISQAMGDNYIAKYGQIVNPEVSPGDYVEAGQTIAYVNEPTMYFTKEGDNIYFAVEKDGESLDPLNFIDYED